ncbi:MAG TPA: HAD-IB family phosphatase [Thermoplasmata archaeon]|nr:HAD-IB family phosphatase [Thermoplasmata archaeon]
MLKLVALDMDGTLVDVPSSWRVIHDHFDDHNDEGLRLFLANKIDDQEFIRMDIRVWWKHAPELSIDDLERILADVPLMPGAHELIEGLHARGARTAIVSGGLDVLARRVAGELGIEVALANGVRLDSEGLLTGEGIVRVPIHGKERVLAALQDTLGVDPAETASVGNSEIDVGLFRRSRVGVAFLPEDEEVRKAATAVVTERNLARVLDALKGFS